MEILVALLLILGFIWVLRRPRQRREHKKTYQNTSKSPEHRPDPQFNETTQKPQHPRRITSGIEHAPPPEIPASRQLNGKAHVIDGDTIVVQKIKVRLAGIDAPELDQPWGQKSKWEMVRICKGHVIRVELTGETSYDRLVGTCYLPDERDIGAEIIRAGLALDGGHHSKGKYRHLEPPGIRKKLRFYGRWR